MKHWTAKRLTPTAELAMNREAEAKMSENSGRHNVIGSGLVIAVVAALLLVLFA